MLGAYVSSDQSAVSPDAPSVFIRELLLPQLLYFLISTSPLLFFSSSNISDIPQYSQLEVDAIVLFSLIAIAEPAMRWSVLPFLFPSVFAAQPSAPAPIRTPLRDLHLGQLNFLHTTDTHGWLAGHLLE